MPRTTPTRTPSGRRPSTAGYWVGVLAAVLATVGAVAWGTLAFLGWRAHVEDFPRLTPPGTAVVSVTHTGTRFLYLEHERSAASPAVPTITVSGPSGIEVPLTAYRGELRYDVPVVANQIGDAVATFPATETGAYRITVTDAGTGATVAIGDDLLSGWGPHVVGAIALLVGGLLVGATLVIVTATRRSAHAT